MKYLWEDQRRIIIIVGIDEMDDKLNEAIMYALPYTVE